MDEYFLEIEKYAKENDVPIMNKRGINFLCRLIDKNDVKNILEIGSAIGYSALKMASVSDDIKIVTIERDQERYLKAIKHNNDIIAQTLVSSIILIFGEF